MRPRLADTDVSSTQGKRLYGRTKWHNMKYILISSASQRWTQSESKTESEGRQERACRNCLAMSSATTPPEQPMPARLWLSTSVRILKWFTIMDASDGVGAKHEHTTIKMSTCARMGLPVRAILHSIK